MIQSNSECASGIQKTETEQVHATTSIGNRAFSQLIGDLLFPLISQAAALAFSPFINYLDFRF
jgi:hypothetical protein